MILGLILGGIGIVAVGMAVETVARLYADNERERVLSEPLPPHWRPPDEE